MTLTHIGILLLLALGVVVLILLLQLLGRLRENAARMERIDAYTKAYGDSLAQNQRDMAELIARNQKDMAERQDIRLHEITEAFGRLRAENNRQMEIIRQTVDEKLQSTLENRLTKSFGLVNDRLEQVYKGLGEMQTLAANVGDLKKILSNVKTRGILGEVQLAAILEQILNREQYEENVAVRPGSSERVEFAVRLPGDGSAVVYLPIDAKFPGDSYAALLDAYDTGDKALVEECRKRLVTTILSEGRDISTKYIAPPHTTDFAILFLPVEGLYAEAVQDGLVEELQRRYKVTLAGPTTMAALLNSLQMGFNTLAIEKRSSEVWQLLGAVRTEFENFEGVLKTAQKRLNQANDDLDKLIGVRTRQIRRKLSRVTALDSSEAGRVIDEESD